jgi:flagellar hook-length control protein FliK
MKELPIISSAPPAKTAAKSASTETANQDNQGFGNVLARQVSDANKPAEATPPSSANTGKQGSAEESTETATTAVTADSQVAIPADMLAVLLAQQNQTAQPQEGGIIPPALNGQTDANAQLTIDTSATENTTLIDAQNEKSNLIPLAMLPNTTVKFSPAQDIAVTHNMPVANAGKLLAEKSQPFDTKQSNSNFGSPTLQDKIAGDLSTSAQPSGFMPLAANSSAATINQLQVNAPVTQPAWAEEFSQKITWLTTQKNQSAELHLNPPQLGPLDVVVKVNGDQATAMFSSPHAAVREAIEQALPKLREMMADSGIMLGNAMVSDQTSKNEQHAASRQTQHNTKSPVGRTEQTSDAQQIRVTALSRHNGLVDTFA